MFCMLTVRMGCVFLLAKSTTQQLYFILGNETPGCLPFTSGTLYTQQRRHPVCTQVRASALLLSRTLAPLRVKAAVCPPWTASMPIPTSLLCPIWSLSGSLPGHTGYLACPPTLQNLPASPAWNVLLPLPALLFPHLPQRWLNYLLPKRALSTMATRVSDTQSLIPTSVSLSPPPLIII